MTETEGAAAPATEQAVIVPAETEQATPTESVQTDAQTENADTKAPEQTSEDTEKKAQSRSERYRRKISAQAGVIERIETERQELRRQLESLQKSKATDTPPNPSEFANGEWDPAYIAKLSAHESLKAVRAQLDEREQREATERQKQAATSAHQRLEESAAKVRERLPDFDETLKAFLDDGGEFAPHVQAAVSASGERAAIVAYNLAKDPELVERLNAMPREEALMEIGELRAKARLPEPRTQTKAPAPITALKGGAAPGTDINRLAKSDDVSAYAAARKAQMKARA